MLIAFHSVGRRAGKDTAGQFMGEWCRDHGIRYERRAFADKMKLLAAEALGIKGATDAETIALVDQFKLGGQLLYWLQRPTSDPEGDARPEDAITGRDFIINLAGENEHSGARKLFGDRFWIEQCLPESPTAHQQKCIAVTDLRFDVEADHVHYLGGVVVEIRNPRAEFMGGRSEKGLSQHAADAVVDNDSTLDVFKERIRAVAGHYCPQKLLPTITYTYLNHDHPT